MSVCHERPIHCNCCLCMKVAYTGSIKSRSNTAFAERAAIAVAEADVVMAVVVVVVVVGCSQSWRK